MKNVMKNAWEIAKEGQKKFGGKVKEYFAEALKIAWNSFKKGVEKMNNGVKGIIQKPELPALQGSPKQIEWAKSIRIEAIQAMQKEVVYEEWKEGQPKCSVKELVNALMSEERVQAYIDDKPEFLRAGVVKSMNDALDRFTRMSEILANADAKFWIDNRSNQEKNYMNNAFKAYVAKGVKNF